MPSLLSQAIYEGHSGGRHITIKLNRADICLAVLGIKEIDCRPSRRDAHANNAYIGNAISFFKLSDIRETRRDLRQQP